MGASCKGLLHCIDRKPQGHSSIDGRQDHTHQIITEKSVQSETIIKKKMLSEQGKRGKWTVAYSVLLVGCEGKNNVLPFSRAHIIMLGQGRKGKDTVQGCKMNCQSVVSFIDMGARENATQKNMESSHMQKVGEGRDDGFVLLVSYGCT